MKEINKSYNKVMFGLLIINFIVLSALIIVFYFGNLRRINDQLAYDAEIITSGIYIIILILLKFDLNRFILNQESDIPRSFVDMFIILVGMAGGLLISVLCLLASMFAERSIAPAIATFINIVLFIFFFIYLVIISQRKRSIKKHTYKPFAIPENAGSKNP